MHYFAYGSNMSLARLQARVPSAKRIGLYRLQAHELRFHKDGRDHSAKCDALYTGDVEHVIFGALFVMDGRDKPALDEVEGVGYGYEEKAVQVSDDKGELVEAFTYIATHIDKSLKPYSWYLNHVLIGAREIQVPDWYLRQLESIPSMQDDDLERDSAQRAIYLS